MSVAVNVECVLGVVWVPIGRSAAGRPISREIDKEAISCACSTRAMTLCPMHSSLSRSSRPAPLSIHTFSPICFLSSVDDHGIVSGSQRLGGLCVVLVCARRFL